MARKFWPGSNPVGQTIFIGPGLGPAYQVGVTEIVGVVDDVRERLDQVEPQPVMYQTFAQIPDADMALVNGYEPSAVLIRTKPGVVPLSTSQAVQQALLTGDQLPATKVRTIDQLSLDSTARQNFNLMLLSVFAAIALLLAAVGIYSVTSYSVEQRIHDSRRPGSEPPPRYESGAASGFASSAGWNCGRSRWVFRADTTVRFAAIWGEAAGSANFRCRTARSAWGCACSCVSPCPTSQPLRPAGRSAARLMVASRRLFGC
jgi:hypothetical protein